MTTPVSRLSETTRTTVAHRTLAFRDQNSAFSSLLDAALSGHNASGIVCIIGVAGQAEVGAPAPLEIGRINEGETVHGPGLKWLLKQASPSCADGTLKVYGADLNRSSSAY
jgi:hypothetical protein